MTRAEVLDYLGLPEDVLWADGFDDCVVGGTCFLDNDGWREVLVYNITQMIWKLVEEGLTPEEAYEFLHFNTLGAYVGKKGPIYIRSLF